MPQPQAQPDVYFHAGRAAWIKAALRDNYKPQDEPACKLAGRVASQIAQGLPVEDEGVAFLLRRRWAVVAGNIKSLSGY